jgi:hypothetical protein
MYKLLKDHLGNEYGVVIEKDGLRTSIPMVDDNTDYQAYLAWVAEGNTPLPAEEQA